MDKNRKPSTQKSTTTTANNAKKPPIMPPLKQSTTMTTTAITTTTALRNTSREAPHTTDPRNAKTTALALLEQKRATLDSKREQLRSKMSATTLSRPPTSRTLGAEHDSNSPAASSTKRAREVQESEDSVVRAPKRAAIEVAGVELNGDRVPFRNLLSSRQTNTAKIMDKAEEASGIMAIERFVGEHKDALRASEMVDRPVPVPSSPGRKIHEEQDSIGLTSNLPPEDELLTEDVLDSTAAPGSAGLPTSPHTSDLTAFDPSKQLLRRSLRLSGQHLPMSPAPAHEPLGLTDEPAATEGEEIAILEARMMQWCFLNARAAHAFEKQTEVAQQQLWDAWRALTKEREALHVAQRKWKMETDMLAMEEALETQTEQLTRVGEQLALFKENYLTFASALATTTTTMPIVNAVTGDLDELVQELLECDSVLDKMMERRDTSPQKFEQYARSMRSLCACLQGEVDELRECQRLLNEIAAAETTERSLAIGRMQLGERVGGQS